MAGSIHEEFSYLCRLCAAKINALLGVMIFEKPECGRQIDVKIRTCLPIQVLETDQLPKMVCEECGYKLDLLYEFRQKSINTEHILLNLIKEINSTVGNCESIELLEHKSHQETSVILPDSEQLQIQNTHSIQEHHYITDTQELTNSIVNQNVIVHQNEIMLTQQTLELTDQSLQLTHENFTIDPNDIQTVRNEDMAIPVSLEQVRHAQEIDIATDGITVQEQLNTTDMCDDLIENEQYGVKCENFDEHIKNEMKQTVSDTEIDESAESTDDPDYDQRTDDEEYKDEKALDYHMTEEKLQEFLRNANIQSVITDDGKEIICYFCTLCAQMYEDKDAFKNHYENHWIKCDKCTLLLKNENDLNVHRKQLHKRRTKNRDKNNLDCKYETEIDEDDQAEINENNRSDEMKPEDTSVMRRKRWEPKVCSECGKSYRTNYKLNEHMRKHTGEKPYRCHTCEKGFRSKIGLAQHEAKHTGVYDFFCTICGKGFQCRSYLTVHQRVHSDAKPYPCNTCGRNFKTKQSLLDHMNRHLGVKPYMCDICGRGFITKGLCKSHQKVHSGMDNRQYPCEVCNKMFVSKSYLTTHQRIHTGEKPFVCNVCNKGFLTRVDLRIHTTMHTGEKSFVCEMCGKAFARRDALRCHRRSHTGERPYRCDICGQSFTQFSPMAIHKRLHTGERPYACDVCSKTFVSRSTMMSHRAKKHSKIDLFGISIIIPLFGDHLRSLGISHSLIGVLGSTYAALQLLSGPVIGSWSDLRGRKKILILTLFICSINYIVFGLSSSIIIIFLTRIISGIFKHTQNLVRSVIADCVPPDIQPEVCGRLNAISGFGFIIGPVIGGHLAETPNGFTILCLLTSSLLFISLGVTYFFLPNLVMAKAPKSSVTKSDLNSVDSTEKSFSVIGSVYSEIAKAASELKQVNWKVYYDVFLLKFLLGFALAMYYGGSRFIWTEVLNITPKTIGYLISFQSIIGALAGFFCGWIDSQFYKNSHDNVKNFHGFFILACSFIGLSLSRHVFLLILFLIPLAFSSSLLRIFGTEAMLKRSLPDQRGSLIGTSNSLSSLARLIAPLLSGVIGDLCGQYSVLYISVFTSMLAAFISFRWTNAMKKND